MAAAQPSARMMEVYAGFLSHTDHHIGRPLDFLKETGEFDNTLIRVVSDNGASAEGGPAAPTRHRTQYFEMFGHRAIDHDGWRAVCPWPGPSFTEAGKGFGVPITADDLTELDAHHWELYHVAEDPAENHNLAEARRDKLIEIQLRFEFEPTGQPDIFAGKGAPGRAQLYVDGHLVGQAEFPVTMPIGIHPGGLTCGANPGSPVTPDYRAPFRFTGTLHTVTLDLSGDLITDSEADMRIAMARQ